MEETGRRAWRCFEFVCPLFPECGTAVSRCCGPDDYSEDARVAPGMCLELPDRPFFREKPHRQK